MTSSIEEKASRYRVAIYKNKRRVGIVKRKYINKAAANKAIAMIKKKYSDEYYFKAVSDKEI